MMDFFDKEIDRGNGRKVIYASTCIRSFGAVQVICDVVERVSDGILILLKKYFLLILNFLKICHTINSFSQQLNLS
jgi:hypothetical protein